jgi:hypothetical protein
VVRVEAVPQAEDEGERAERGPGGGQMLHGGTGRGRGRGRAGPRAVRGVGTFSHMFLPRATRGPPVRHDRGIRCWCP